jgi:ATP-dependent Clp protease, protease subunit
MPKWLQIINKAAEKVTQLLIYDQIGKDWFSNDGVSAKEFAETLKEVPKDHEIEVFINSPGGNVWDGLAIYHQLQARKDKVTVRVDGIAASIASVIALAGKELQMPANSMLMVHQASGIVIGTAEDMSAMSEKLKQHDQLIADIYAKKTGKSREKMMALMEAETFMNGTEAKQLGFADVVTDEVKLAASLSRVIGQLRRTKPAIQSGDKTTDKNMKAKLIALLAKLGVKVADDATEEQLFADLQTALDKKPSAEIMASIAADVSAVLAEAKAAAAQAKQQAAHPDFAAVQAKLDAMEKKAEAERVRRITGDVKALLAERTYLDDKTVLPRAIADEKYVEEVRAMPIIAAGLEPIRAGAIDRGNSFIEDYRKMKPGKERNDFRVANHEQLVQANHRYSLQPRAANTIASALLPDYLADALVVVVWNRLAALRAHSRDFGVNPLAPKATVQVRKATTGSAAQTNPTNFETGDSTLAAIAVTVNQISKSFQITNQERNSGHRLSHLAQINALLFADAISDVVTALMIAANFGAATVIGAAAAFSTSGLPAIFALAKNYMIRNLILDGDYIARLIPADKFKFDVNFGGAFSAFDGLFMNNKWTGGVANLVGFVCDPRAIAVASGLPESGPPGEFISQGSAVSDDLGLTVQTNEWFSRGGRVNWASFDVMFGAAVGDGTAAENLVSA